MSVAFDANMSAGGGDGGLCEQGTGTGVSSTGLTTGAAPTLLVATMILSNSSSLLSGIGFTWNGVPLSLVAAIYSSISSPGTAAAIGVLVNPAAGNKTLAASWSASGASDYYLSACSFVGTDTITGIKAADTVTTSSSNSPIAINTSSDGATLAISGANPGGGAPSNYNTLWADSSLFMNTGASYQLGGSGQNSHTFVAGTGNIVGAGIHIIAPSASSKSGQMLFASLAPLAWIIRRRQKRALEGNFGVN